MQIGLGTLLTGAPPLIYWFSLVLVPSHGRLRSNTLSHAHLQKLNKGSWLPLLQNFLGFKFCSRSSKISYPMFLLFGVITFPHSFFLPILYFILGLSIWKLIITIFVRKGLRKDLSVGFVSCKDNLVDVFT